jgi:hypothetical protein
MKRFGTQRLCEVALACALILAGASGALAACGCDKPPPPRANVRPFVAHADQTITIFDDRLEPGQRYTVLFSSRDGTTDWSRGRAVAKRDFADGVVRPQLRVDVPDLPYGPAAMTVYDGDRVLVSLTDDQLTVIASPIVLHDFDETISREGYRTGVGADGTIYFAIDTTEVADATTYGATAEGYDFRFDSTEVAVFNSQGFLMTVLDPKVPGLFSIEAGAASVSTTLEYWRHEFRTYKEEHRKRDERRSPDGEWHADGTPHVDNYHMVVAIGGTLSNGKRPTPGSTPAFRLVISSTPSPQSTLH